MASPKLEWDKKDLVELNRFLADAKRRAVNTKPIMVFAVAVMAQETIETFRQQGRSPFSWPALAESTIKQRTREKTWPGQKLIRFAQLWQSLQPGGGGEGSYKRITNDEAEYGTTLAKARPLQEGAKLRFGTLPPRPFMYWTPDSVKKIMAFAASFAFEPGKAKSIFGGAMSMARF